MKPYHSKSGKHSGIVAYEIGRDFIKVRFQSGDVYTYSYASAGIKEVETMKDLAEDNEGLSTYIARNDPGYEG